MTSKRVDEQVLWGIFADGYMREVCPMCKVALGLEFAIIQREPRPGHMIEQHFCTRCADILVEEAEALGFTKTVKDAATTELTITLDEL